MCFIVLLCTLFVCLCLIGSKKYYLYVLCCALCNHRCWCLNSRHYSAFTVRVPDPVVESEIPLFIQILAHLIYRLYTLDFIDHFKSTPYLLRFFPTSTAVCGFHSLLSDGIKFNLKSCTFYGGEHSFQSNCVLPLTFKSLQICWCV